MPDDEQRADHLTFAEAVTTLAEAEAVLRHQLVTDFAEVAMSDNYCARAEALLMLALRYCLVVANGGSASIISVSNAEVQFDDNQLLYVESQYDTCINTQIESHFNELSNMVRLAGFDFVYIPRVSAHYGSISEDDMKRVVRFLYPSVSIERLQLVWDSLQSLKTHEYCRDLLSAKLGLREMAFVAPSVMIKVGDSVVGGESFSNFLLVEVGKMYSCRLNNSLPSMPNFSTIYTSTICTKNLAALSTKDSTAKCSIFTCCVEALKAASWSIQCAAVLVYLMPTR